MPNPPTIRKEELKNKVAAYAKALAAQIAPKAYEHGFLK